MTCRTHFARAGVLLLVVLAGISPSTRAAEERNAQAAPLRSGSTLFAGEPLFSRSITLAVREEPLAEFLAGLRKEQRLRVRADPSTADERVTVFCRERPAGEILAAVARHLEYSWVRKRNDAGVEFVLRQTAEQRARERQLRETMLAEELAGLRERIAEVMEDAHLPPLERRKRRLERFMTRNREWVRSDPERQQRFQKVLEALEQGGWRFAAEDGQDGLGIALLAMQPADWERFWRGEPFRFAFPPRSGRASLNRAQADAVVRASASRLPYRATVEGEHRPDERFQGVERLRGEVFLDTRDGSPMLRFRARSVARVADFRGLWSMRVELPALDRPPETPPQDPSVDPADRELHLEAVIPTAQQRGRERGGLLPLSLADVGAAVAGATPYTVIADGYDDEGREPWRGGRQRLDTWLGETCRPWNVRIRREQGTLFIRHRDWPRRRALHVPDRVTRPWGAALKQEQWLTLQMLLEMSRWSGDQLATVFASRWGDRGVTTNGQGDLLNETFEEANLHALRLVASLTPAEWRRLLQGQVTVLSPRRPERAAALGSWFAADPLGGQTVYEGPDLPRPERPLEGIFELEDALEAGQVPVGLGLVREPMALYAGTDSFYVAPTVEEALEYERAHDLKATQEPPRATPVTSWGFRLALDLRTVRKSGAFGFLTTDHASRRKVNSRPERER